MYDYFPPQYRRPVGIGLIIAGLIVLYFIVKKNDFLSNLLGFSAKAGAEKSGGYNAKKLRPGFKPGNQAVAIAEDLSDVEDWSGEDEKAFDRILDYNDDELKAVHDAWLEQYKGGKFWGGIKDTLRKQVNAEVLGFWRKSATAKKNRILSRLNKLNL